MRKRLTAVLLSSGAVALSLGIGATTAMATTASTWTVTPGGNVTGAAGKTTLKDTKTGTVLTCASSSTTATLKSGSGLSGTGIGSIKTITFNSCTGPLGLVFTVTVNHLPYPLNAKSYSAASGVTTGSITGIDATLTGSGCSMQVDGTAAGANNGTVTGKYTNSTGVLATSGGTLHIYNVVGCFGLVANGDPATFKGSYKITPKQKISSP